MSKLIITLTGPTCAGKTCMERALNARGVGRLISHTTRTPREGEVNGKDYHFVDDEEFDALLRAGKFIEHITLGSTFGSKRYAMSIDAVNAAPEAMVAVVVEPNGMGQIVKYARQHGIPYLTVWLNAHAEVRAERFMDRLGKEPHAALQRRLGLMLGEEQRWIADAYGGGYDLAFERAGASNEVNYAQRIIKLAQAHLTCAA